MNTQKDVKETGIIPLLVFIASIMAMSVAILLVMFGYLLASVI
jgi:hypothetical protein